MTQAVWTRSMVENRLLEAQRVIEQTVRGDDGGGGGSSMPEYIDTEENRMEWMRTNHDRLMLEGYIDPNTGLLIKPVPLRWGSREEPEAAMITRAEIAMMWPTMHVRDDTQRICLVCYVLFKANSKHGFSKSVNQRLKRLFLPPLSRGHLYVMKDKALDCIAAALTADRFPITDLDIVEKRPLKRTENSWHLDQTEKTI